MSVFTSDVTVEPGTSPIVIDGGNSNPVVISGTVTANVGTGTQPVSGTVTANQGTSPWVTVTNTVTSNTANITQVVATNAVNVQLIAANANRKKLIIFFPKGTATSYVKFGAGASSVSYTYIIASNNTTLEILTWTGEVDFNGAAQTVAITELV